MIDDIHKESGTLKININSRFIHRRKERPNLCTRNKGSRECPNRWRSTSKDGTKLQNSFMQENLEKCWRTYERVKPSGWILLLTIWRSALGPIDALTIRNRKRSVRVERRIMIFPSSEICSLL